MNFSSSYNTRFDDKLVTRLRLKDWSVRMRVEIPMAVSFNNVVLLAGERRWINMNDAVGQKQKVVKKLVARLHCNIVGLFN
jgi:hypothetical protein